MTKQTKSRIDRQEIAAFLKRMQKPGYTGETVKESIELEFMKDMWNPAPPLGIPSNVSKILDSPRIGLDPMWKIYPGEQFVNDCFESDEMKNFCLKVARDMGHASRSPHWWN